MKKIVSITISFMLFVSLTFAQNVDPKFEKQEDLTKATYFYDNGNVKEVGFFNGDKLQGKWISYNQKGEVTAIANYEHGKKNGKWYIVENDLVKELTYESNKLVKVTDVKKSDLPLI